MADDSKIMFQDSDADAEECGKLVLDIDKDACEGGTIKLYAGQTLGSDDEPASIELRANGDIYVNGRKAANDLEVVVGLRAFLTAARIREQAAQGPTYFVSGHLDLTQEEFDLYYMPRLLHCAAAEGASFVIGDARGGDYLSQALLWKHGFLRNVTVFHMFDKPRNNPGFQTKGGFTSDEERDIAMTAASTADIAWVRPGREKSGTAKNLTRRKNFEKARKVHSDMLDRCLQDFQMSGTQIYGYDGNRRREPYTSRLDMTAQRDGVVVSLELGPIADEHWLRSLLAELVGRSWARQEGK